MKEDWKRLWAVSLFAAPLAQAQTNDFGVGGVLDVPSARSPDESTLTVSYSRKDVADIYAIGYQPLPRLEASFRYTIFGARLGIAPPDTPCAKDPSFCDYLKDRSFELRYRLLDEGRYLPAVTAGIRDLLGTGNWSAEYLVANKQFGPLDLSLGMGWGRLAERAVGGNPLGRLSDRFYERDYSGGDNGGLVALKQFYRGPEVGLFGSARYTLPGGKFDLLAAYNSDSYARERRLGVITDAKPLSYGLEWQAWPGVRLGLSRQQGNAWAAKLSAAIDTSQRLPRKAPNGFGARRDSLVADTRPEPGVQWWVRLIYDAESSGLLVPELQEKEDGILVIRYSNRAYQFEADAVHRLLSLVRLYAPPTLRTVVLTGDAGGMPTHSVTWQRPEPRPDAPLEDPGQIEVAGPMEIAEPTWISPYDHTPHASWSAGLGLRTYLFDPDFPLLTQVQAKLRGNIDFGGGWMLTAAWTQALTSDFDRIQRSGNSKLKPVRTLLREYMQEGKSGIDELSLVKRGKLGTDVYYQAFGGILEEMYTGAGGEMLWAPSDATYGVGLVVIGARQREFDKLFGLRDLDVVTAHVSGYWATPFRNFDVAVHAGRYMAGDIGATIEVQKRFANGWSVGAFATLTDVPFDVFGEGSFDKGLIFRIPLDFYTSGNSQNAYRTILRSINRDGGRMIDSWPGSLWEQIRGTRRDFLLENRDRMVP
ncbi:MAG: hypothetical protein RL026_622 [Pseudomonadota bacterium]